MYVYTNISIYIHIRVYIYIYILYIYVCVVATRVGGKSRIKKKLNATQAEGKFYV